MTRHELLRQVRRHRGPVAGVLAAVAVLLGLPALAPAAGSQQVVVVAARDLAPGTRLTADDLRTTSLPAAAAPQGVVTDASALVGSTVSGRVREGEALTDVRVLGASLLRAPGLVAAPVRLADAASASLLHAGDRVDVLAATTSSDAAQQAATTVARALQVLAVPAPQDDSGEGGLVVLAASPDAAARLAAAAVGSRLSVTLLPAG